MGRSMIPDAAACDFSGRGRVSPLVNERSSAPCPGFDVRAAPTPDVCPRRTGDRRATVVADLAAAALAGRGIATIADRLGVDTWAASGSVAAGLLMIVARVADLAQRGGADALAAVTASSHDDGLLDDLPAFLEQWSRRLAQPAGAEQVAGVCRAVAADVLARSSGLHPAHADLLLALLSPVVLAVIERERRERQLDRDAFVHLLALQRAEGMWVADLATRLYEASPADR